MTEFDRLASRFKEEAADRGLVDVKFLLRNTDEATQEDVCRGVNDMLDAFDRGDAVDLDFKDASSIH